MKRLLLALPLMIFVVIGIVAVVMLNASSQGERDSRAIGFSMTGSTLPEITMPRLGGGAVIDAKGKKGHGVSRQGLAGRNRRQCQAALGAGLPRGQGQDSR